MFRLFETVVRSAVLVLAALISDAASGDEPSDQATDFLAALAEPVFEAAEISPELQPTITLVADDAPGAAIYSATDARLTTGLFMLAATPEELAAAIARLVAIARIDMAGVSMDKRFRFTARVPSQNVLRGSISSIDEAMAAPGIEAARDTMKSREAAGPSIEEIRSRARRADAEALELMRRANIPDTALLSLYRRLSRAGSGLFERADYEGRRILLEQISWLEERVAEQDEARSPLWAAFDDQFAEIRAALQP